MCLKYSFSIMKQRAQGYYKNYMLLTYKIISLMPSSKNNNFTVLCCLNSIYVYEYKHVGLYIVLLIILIIEIEESFY